jgi:hypothetical protein
MRKETTAAWMAMSFGVALAIVLAIGLAPVPGDKLIIALKVTARWSFAFFWLASSGGALATLFGSRFKSLAARARDFGLSFASAHVVHLGLVGCLYYFYIGPPNFILIIFGIAAFWTYLLALLSIRRVSAALSPGLVRILRTVGVEYIAIAFLYDFAKNPLGRGVAHLVSYLPFLLLAIAGPLLRISAAVKRSRQQTPINFTGRARDG